MKLNDQEIEIQLLIEAIKLKYGYDFSGYSKASLTRRILKGLSESSCKKVSELIPLIIHDKNFFYTFALNLSVNVTSMFRDPPFYKQIRETIIPYLKTFPFIKVWSAGVASGEELYSMAILLKEEGLYDKALLYATDFNDAVLQNAEKAIYPADEIKKSTKNYQASGGKESFGDYYHADYKSVIFDRALKKNVVFANHNLVTDGVFGEMHLILCRNVLIYFNTDLQNRVLNLFDDSLCPNGFLCLGTKETLEFSDIDEFYTPVAKKQRIYQKKIVRQSK